MTPRRRRLVRRRADGTFLPWPGGRSKSQLKPHKRRQSFQGIAAHIGANFKAHNGRAARTGDVHRTRKSDGTFHKQAYWYVKTPAGWRRSHTLTRKPTPAQVRAIIAGAQPGRKHKPSTRRKSR